MSDHNKLFDTPKDAKATLVLAHGSGQAMNSAFMNEMAARICADTNYPVEVVRFNFPYMILASESGRHRPPDRAPVLLSAWREVIDSVRPRAHRLFIGGKSLGGRVATMLADDAGIIENVDGVVCLGYPFHPPKKPEKLRTTHLKTLQTPTLIVQGERDPFGNREEVANYSLSRNIRFEWMTDGEHGFKPRKSSGTTLEDNLDAAAAAIIRFMADINQATN
ncbi:MAG: alpha/beta hydrolase [marine bacterium B5-7]|nr:MAG: alpha/beta hydrolase [marine bacterium B5-7]